MTNKEAVNWLINITADIGKTEHRDLWHYEQALTEIKDMLESEQPEIVRCGECELKLVCCRTIRSDGRRADDFCSCGIREERKTDD